jgi:hypothetical protein
MNMDDIETPFAAAPAKFRNGLWNDIGVSELPRREDFAAPCWGPLGGGEPRIAAMSTRSSGHGMP